jgi:hypothetical protein
VGQEIHIREMRNKYKILPEKAHEKKLGYKWMILKQICNEDVKWIEVAL